MWVRNGHQIRGQAMTYIQSHFCKSTIDIDIYLLQVTLYLFRLDFFVVCFGFLLSVVRDFRFDHSHSVDSPLLLVPFMY